MIRTIHKNADKASRFIFRLLRKVNKWKTCWQGGMLPTIVMACCE